MNKALKALNIFAWCVMGIPVLILFMLADKHDERHSTDKDD